MPTAAVTTAPRPPRLVVEVVEDAPDGEVRVHLALDLRLPLNLPDLEALALRMTGELARNAHAAAAGVVLAGGGYAGPGDGVVGHGGSSAVAASSGAGGGGRGSS